MKRTLCALSPYISLPKQEHLSAVLKKVELVIDPKYFYFAASPDSLVLSAVCGEGCVEVKCPLTIKDGCVKDLILKRNSGLIEHNEQIQLDAFYYQIQMQLAITEKAYCDFIVWSPQDF
jgi:hypothetical protein